MRSRNIKPGFWVNDLLGEVPFESRLCFIGLWCIADFNGNIEYRPAKIRATLFPYDHIDIELVIANLCEKLLVMTYDVGGVRYLHIPNFNKHQHPHPNEIKAGTEIPLPERFNENIIASNYKQLQEIANQADILIPDSNSILPISDKKPDLHQERFDSFWKAYPRKIGKGQALKIWKKLKPSQALTDQIVTHLTLRAGNDKQWKESSFIPHPSTWLNRSGWEDEYDGMKKADDKPKASILDRIGKWEPGVPRD